MADSEKYVDMNRVVVEVRPRWGRFTIRIVILLILLLAAFFIALDVVDRIKDAPGDWLGSNSPVIGEMAVFIILFTVSGVLLAFHVFWVLRGRWSIRVTPKALLYRGWFSVMEIPWDEIAVVTTQEPMLSVNMNSVYIHIKQGSRIPLKVPFGVKSSFFMVPNIRNYCLVIRQFWFQHEPAHLAKILEKYRREFSGPGTDCGEEV